jgi:ribosome-associated protein
MERLKTIGQQIYDKKGSNILVLDVRGICSMTDFFILAEGTSQKHVQTLARSVSDRLAQEKLKPWYVEGVQDSDWIVLDYGNIVVHLLTSSVREHYLLEQLWSEGELVDLALSQEVSCLKKE